MGKMQELYTIAQQTQIDPTSFDDVSALIRAINGRLYRPPVSESVFRVVEPAARVSKSPPTQQLVSVLREVILNIRQSAITLLEETLLTQKPEDARAAIQLSLEAVEESTAMTDDAYIEVRSLIPAGISTEDVESQLALLTSLVPSEAEGVEPEKVESQVPEPTKFIREVEVGPPAIVFVWDPEIVSEDDYAELFHSLGNLVRAHGGIGLKVLEEQQFGVAAEGVQR